MNRPPKLTIVRIGDVELSNLQPKKAFILGSIEKEMRLSFANRVRGTLPEEYHVLISTSKDNEIPDYKYNNECTVASPSSSPLY